MHPQYSVAFWGKFQYIILYIMKDNIMLTIKEIHFIFESLFLSNIESPTFLEVVVFLRLSQQKRHFIALS